MCLDTERKGLAQRRAGNRLSVSIQVEKWEVEFEAISRNLVLEIDLQMHFESGNSRQHDAVRFIWNSNHISRETVEDLACQSTSYLFPLKGISLFYGCLCFCHLWRFQNQASCVIVLLLLSGAAQYQ